MTVHIIYYVTQLPEICLFFLLHNNVVLAQNILQVECVMLLASLKASEQTTLKAQGIVSNTITMGEGGPQMFEALQEWHHLCTSIQNVYWITSVLQAY